MIDSRADLPALGELLEHAGDGIILTDAKARIRWVSSGVEHLFGYDREELVGRDLHLLLPVHLRDAHARWVRQFRDGATESRAMAGSRVVVGRHRSGREVSIEASISRLENGRTLGVILHDASKRAASGMLHEHLAHARQLADALPVLISFIDDDLRYRFVNQGYVEWSGRPREEIEGATARSIVGEAAFTRAEPHLRAALAGERRRYRNRVRTAGGDVREVDTLLVPAAPDSADVAGVFVVAVAVPPSDRFAALRTVMTEAGRLLSATLDPEIGLPSVVRLATGGFADRAEAFIREPEGVIRSFRAASSEGHGHECALRTEELPQSVGDTMADGASRTDCCLTDQWVYVTHAIPGPTGVLGTLRFGWAPPYDPSLEEYEVGHDLAARVGAAFEHARAVRQGREATLQRDWIMERVLHDLGGPTASIWMVADRMLRTGPAPDRRASSRSHLEAIAHQAKELERLIIDLRSATKLRAGHAVLSRAAVDVDEMVSDVLTLLAPLATWHGTELEAVRMNESRSRVLADPYHVRRLISALVMNAVRGAERGASVRTRILPRERDVLFEIIAPYVGHEPEADPRPKSKGSGESERSRTQEPLDLTIAKEIAESQGTSVSILLDGSSCRTSFTLPKAG